MVDATRLGAWLRPGEGIGWLAVGTMPNSLYRMPAAYLFLTCIFCYSCSFFYVVFCLFVFFFCSHRSLVDRCSSDLFLSSRPRTGLATTYSMVEARSINVKKTKTTVERYDSNCTGFSFLSFFAILIRVCMLSSYIFWTLDLWTHEPGSHWKVTQNFSTFLLLHACLNFYSEKDSAVAFPRRPWSRVPTKYSFSTCWPASACSSRYSG